MGNIGIRGNANFRTISFCNKFGFIPTELSLGLTVLIFRGLSGKKTIRSFMLKIYENHVFLFFWGDAAPPDPPAKASGLWALLPGTLPCLRAPRVPDSF